MTVFFTASQSASTSSQFSPPYFSYSSIFCTSCSRNAGFSRAYQMLERPRIVLSPWHMPAVGIALSCRQQHTALCRCADIIFEGLYFAVFVREGVLLIFPIDGGVMIPAMTRTDSLASSMRAHQTTSTSSAAGSDGRRSSQREYFPPGSFCVCRRWTWFPQSPDRAVPPRFRTTAQSYTPRRRCGAVRRNRRRSAAHPGTAFRIRLDAL